MPCHGCSARYVPSLFDELIGLPLLRQWWHSLTSGNDHKENYSKQEWELSAWCLDLKLCISYHGELIHCCIYPIKYLKLDSNMPSQSKMSGVAWLAIAIFAGIVVMIALVYLYTLKVRRYKEGAIRKAENDEIFGGVIRNPIMK